MQRAVAQSNGALVPNGRPFEVAPYGIAVAQQRKQLAQAIQGALKAMIDDGSYQQILDKWDISEGAIDDPQIMTRRDIPKPEPLSTESFAPASPVPTPSSTSSYYG